MKKLPKTLTMYLVTWIIVCRDCNLTRKKYFTEFFEDEDEEDVDNARRE